MGSINIPVFLDGYNVENMNCLDIAIAGGASHFNNNNYFFYSFFKCFNLNWGGELKDFISEQNEILSLIGLKIKKIHCNVKTLLNEIKYFIDEGSPVLIPTKYNSLFFCSNYMDMKYKSSHFLLISDYINKKKIIEIRECIHVNRDIRPLTKSAFFSRFQLTEDMVTEIWEMSNSQFKFENSDFADAIFVLTKDEEFEPLTFTDLLDYFVSQELKSRLCNIIRYFKLLSNNDSFKIYRRHFSNSLVMLFDCFDKAVEEHTLNPDLVLEYNDIKEGFLKYRDNLLSILMANKLRNKTIECERLVNEVIEYDQKLMQIIKTIHTTITLHITHPKTITLNLDNTFSEEVNYALNSKVIASSCLRPASNTVNGSLTTDDSWSSQGSIGPHWLIFDLGEKKTLYKFILKHWYENPKKIITDYEIQGSENQALWETIISITDNNMTEAVYHINDLVSYRYLRLYITLPGYFDNKARIVEFEAWGKANVND